MSIQSISISARVLRELRLRAGIPQPHFAELLGVHQSRLSRWENGRTKCRVNRQLLSGIKHPALKTLLVKRSLETLQSKLRSGCLPASLACLLPSSYIRENADAIYLAVSEELKSLWLESKMQA